ATLTVVDGDVAANTPDKVPLKLLLLEAVGVAQEMHSRLRWEGSQKREGIQPIQVVCDQNVVTGFGNVLWTLEQENEKKVEEGKDEDARETVCGRRLPLDGEQIGRRSG